MEKYKQLNLFEALGVSIEEEKPKENKTEEIDLEEYAKEHEPDWIVPNWETKRFYFSSIPTSEYIYSVKSKDGDNLYLCFQTGETIIVNTCGIDNESDLLKGKETIVFPALYIDFYDNKGNKKTDIHYSSCPEDSEKDDRQKWIINFWHMDKVSWNRIEKSKPAKEFYEIEFKLPDYIEWLKNDIKHRDYTIKI